MACTLFFYKLALCTKLSELKLSQVIGNQRGKHNTFMQAFVLELGEYNQHNTTLDIKSEISLIDWIE